MKPRRNEERELAERAYMLRSWKKWHAEQLTEALAGVHGTILKRLMAQLKELHSARELVAFISEQDWSAVDANTRLVALHEINQAITKLRERAKLPPIDDPLPGQPECAFRIIKTIVNQFPAPVGKGPAGGVPGKS